MTDAGAKCFTCRVAVAQVVFFFCCFQPVISSCGFGLPVSLSVSLSRFKVYLSDLGLPVSVSLSRVKRLICQILDYLCQYHCLESGGLFVNSWTTCISITV